MAALNIRQLPDDVHASLRVRAAHNGRSMEAEASDILARACTDDGQADDAPEGSSQVRDAAHTPVTVTLDPVVAEAARRQAARFGTTVEDWIRQVAGPVFIDTNILVYTADRGDPQRQALCRALVQPLRGARRLPGRG